MIKKSILFIGLIILNWNPVHADDAVCRLLYAKLSELPHTKLTLNTNGFVSIWNGQQSDGCEVVFETDESKVSGKVIHQKFESIINWQGWSINEKLIDCGLL